MSAGAVMNSGRESLPSPRSRDACGNLARAVHDEAPAVTAQPQIPL
jgi:hypothetical protein